jgi:nucleotide-binding universal stress UspA family protein
MQPLLAPYVEPRFRAQLRAVEAAGFRVSAELAPGLPAPEIDRIAQEREASLIVVGSHGATLAREALLGSVALDVLQRARVPVFVAQLVIEEQPGATDRCAVICTDYHRHILFPTDFSDTAERAFQYVEEIVRGGGKEVTLLHVQDQTRLGSHLKDRLDEFNRIDEARLARLKDRLLAEGAESVQTRIPYGSPTREIVQAAESAGATLIVMGTQGRGFLGELLLGSVSHQVARHTHVPMLLVPPHAVPGRTMYDPYAAEARENGHAAVS